MTSQPLPQPLTPLLSPYPGSGAAAEQILDMAEEYRLAAQALLAQGRKGQPISRAPAHLCAIHAIELYLNAFLLRAGETHGEIRSRQHDLAGRTVASTARGLRLRAKTVAHLHTLTAGREYLVSRYGPEMTTSLSQVNRLIATLEEVARKVATQAPAPEAKSPAKASGG